MNPTSPAAVLSSFSPVTFLPVIYELFLKGLFIVAFGIYMAFAFLMIRQVRLMGQTVETTLEPILLIIAIAHFAIAVMVFLAAIFLL